MSTFRLPEATSVDSIHLRVRNLQEASRFYTTLLGFKEVMSEGNKVGFAASGKPPAQVLLTEDYHAPQRSRSSVGLFHVAYLFPNRRELAKAFRRLYDAGYPFQGASDHGVSEALYLADPEGNGIELYADRPRDQWQVRNGELHMYTAPLDIDHLMRELEGATQDSDELQPDVHIGHIHLQVSSLASAERFYHRILGFDVTTRSYPGALFVAAGGYHHHLGLNIWNSRGAPKATKGALGLTEFGVHIPDALVLSEIERRLVESGLPVEWTENGKVLKTEDFDGMSIMLHL
ncbi:MAG TPA: VOC family protein [Bacteroidota bacterium]|nr:VOC family protein [Bacteroidota bacterium]